MRLRDLPCLCRQGMARDDRHPGPRLAGSQHAELRGARPAQLASVVSDRRDRSPRWAYRAYARGTTLGPTLKATRTGGRSMSPPLDDAVHSAASRIPLDAIDVSDPQIYQDDTWYPYFARLRREDPVHYVRDSRYGPYWAVTKYKDIMQVEVNHQVYSSASELGGIQIEEQPKGMA